MRSTDHEGPHYAFISSLPLLPLSQSQISSAAPHCYPLTPNDSYMGRTTPLTSKRCILYIYSTNAGTVYFKHALYSPFFSLQNAVCFIMLISLVPVLFTFHIQAVLKLKKNNSGTKGLNTLSLYSSLNHRKHVSHPHKTGKINKTCLARENIFTRISAAVPDKNNQFAINFTKLTMLIQISFSSLHN